MTVAVDLDGFSMGAGTAYEVRPEGIQGVLGAPTIRTSDVARGHADGAVAGFDYYDGRLITIPVTVLGDTPADCREKIQALTAAWDIVSDLSTVQLTIHLWGEVYSFPVRPRGAHEDDLSSMASGVAFFTCEAFAPDPDPVVS